MAHLTINHPLLSTLHDKVVVLTGGSTGIGAATVSLLHAHGAKVIFGDINTTAGSALAAHLDPSFTAVHYQHTDTSSYASLLALFAFADKLYSCIDIVIANAGVAVHKDIFAPDSDWSVEPSMIELDVNAKGVLFTCRIALGWFRKYGKGGDLVLTSSIAGFKECKGLVAYTASKHYVIGIGRGLYLQAQEERVRVNVVCPWMTKTGMVRGIEEGWAKLSLPENEPEDVAKAIVLCATANRGKGHKGHENAELPFAGKIIWVGGGEAYEIEDNIQRLEPQWLGEENSRVLEKGQAFLADTGTSWDVHAKAKAVQ